MKSKITRMKPEEVGNMKFKEAKMILKKDLGTLQTLGPEGSSFFVSTEFDFEDEKGATILIVGQFKGEWKKYVKVNTKPPHKTTATGTALMSGDGATLTLNIEKGKAKPKEIEKALKKAKLIPSSINNVIFNETPKLESDDEIDATDEDESVEVEAVEENVAEKDTDFPKIVAETKNYKGIAADNFEARLSKIKEIDDFIAEWEKKNNPIKGNKEKETRNATLQKLRAQLQSHRLDIGVNSRKGAESIDAIVKGWEDYKKRPQVQGAEALADIEDRMDSILDLNEKIKAWLSRNPAPYCKEEQKVKDSLDQIIQEIETEEKRLATELPLARKAGIKAILEKLTKATPQEKEALKKDEMFLWELSRTVPVAQTNDARKLLGLDPIKEEKEDDKEPEVGELDMLKDPEIQALFKDFAKFSTFEVAVDHKANPGMAKKIKLVAGVQIWKEGKTEKDKFALTEDYTFELISEDNKGNMRLKLGASFYYSVRNANTIESQFKTLPVDTSLFPEAPSKSHVLQGGLGDCYLLATLASLAAKDPNAIIDMMMDKGDTVTVRLFEVKVDPKDPNKRTFKAKYINVDKSIPVIDGKDLFTKTHLWVQMIEKAYAAGKFSGTFDDQKNNSNNKGTYEGMESGFFAYASEVLTGKPSEFLYYMNLAESPKDFVVTGIPNSERGKDTGNNSVSTAKLPWCTSELNIFKGKNPKYDTTLAYTIFGNDLSKTVKWATYVKAGAIEKLFAREYSGNYSGEPTLEDFELLFQGKMKDADDNDVAGLPVLEPAIAKEMLDWLKGQAFYPGKRGSGLYSALQLSLFKDIKDALAGGKIVGLSSKQLVGRSNEGVGHSGGEGISGGLVGGHAYSVLDTRENDPQKELEIRNPWGSTVQRNVKVSDRIAEIEKTLKDIIAKILEPIKKELLELKGLIEDIRPKIENEADKDKKKLLKDQYDLWATRYKELIAKRDEYADLSDLTVFKEKVGASKKDYEKGLTAIEALKKKDPNEMVSTQEENLQGQEGGEFWLFLDDLTRRFRRVHIG